MSHFGVVSIKDEAGNSESLSDREIQLLMLHELKKISFLLSEGMGMEIDEDELYEEGEE